MKKPVLKYVIAALIVFASTMYLRAQGPPTNTETPIMLGLEGSGFRTFAK